MSQLRGKQCHKEISYCFCQKRRESQSPSRWRQASIFDWLNWALLRTMYNQTVWVIMNPALNAMQNSLRAGTSRWKWQNNWNCRPCNGYCCSRLISRLALDLRPQVETFILPFPSQIYLSQWNIVEWDLETGIFPGTLNPPNQNQVDLQPEYLSVFQYMRSFASHNM